MKFTKLFAYPIWPESIKVLWEIDNPQLTGDYLFMVQLLDSTNSILYNSGTLYNKYSFIIKYTPLLYKEIRQDLQVKVTCTPPYISINNDVVPFSETINLYHKLDKQEFYNARELVRKQTLYFEKKIGLRVLVLKAKKFGPVCTYCVDPNTNTIFNSNCTACYGTKIKDGYHTPEETWAEIVEAPVNKQTIEVGTIEQKMSQIRLTNKVLVSTRDVIIDIINNNRWEVQNEPSITRYRSFPIDQQFNASLVSPKSIINKVDVSDYLL